MWQVIHEEVFKRWKEATECNYVGCFRWAEILVTEKLAKNKVKVQNMYSVGSSTVQRVILILCGNTEKWSWLSLPELESKTHVCFGSIHKSPTQTSCKSHIFKWDPPEICNSTVPLTIIRSRLKHQANQRTLMYDTLDHAEVLKWATSLFRHT